MKDFDVIIKIGTSGANEDEALDKLSHILFYIQENLPMDNFKLEVEERGEYV